MRREGKERFGCILWHINRFRLFNAKSSLHMHTNKMICQHFVDNIFLNEPELFKILFAQRNASNLFTIKKNKVLFTITFVCKHVNEWFLSEYGGGGFNLFLKGVRTNLLVHWFFFFLQLNVFNHYYLTVIILFNINYKSFVYSVKWSSSSISSNSI